MKLKLLVRDIYKNTSWGYVIILPFKWTHDLLVYRLIPPKLFIKWKFWRSFGYLIDLQNPKSLNEKIQWLKVYYNKSDFHTKCTDKLEVKEYIKDTIGQEFVVPLVFETTRYKDIRPENIPDYPVIIKATHNSGGYNIIKDKNNVDWNLIRRDCKRWLSENYYYIGKEQQYKNIKPKIIIEKLLLDENGKTPMDFKVHCLNGEPEMIQVDLDRGTEKHCRNWYDVNWRRSPFQWSSLYPDGKLTTSSSEEIKKPDLLLEMLNLSGFLAKNFIYVRIDWYICNNRLYFGEFTFHHDGGFRPILPNEFDIKLGEKLKLPITENFEKR